MFQTAHTGTLLLAVFFSFSGQLSAQDAAAFHQFADKKGQKISAMVLGVSPDNQKMRIRREDGQEFEMVINLLSLDDQQYLKDWMKTRTETASTGSAKSDFRLEAVITRLGGPTVKHAGESYNMVEKATFFRVVVKNLSRETLEGAEVEYAVVWEDRATIFKTTKEQWSFSYRDEDESARVKMGGVLPLGPVRFNEEVSVETSPGSIDTILRGGNDVFQEDEMLGIKVRVRAKDGTVIYQTDYGSAVIASLEWEEIESLDAPRVIN